MPTYNIDSGKFGERYVFTITHERIVYQTDHKHISWSNDEVAKVRFGSQRLEYGRFGGSLGDRYRVAFLNFNGSIIELEFLNTLDSKPTHKKFYDEIVSLVREIFIDNTVRNYITQVNAGDTIVIDRLRINSSGISVVETGLSFKWDELVLMRDEYRFMMTKRHAPEFKFVVNLGDWDSETIYGLISKLKIS